MNAQNLFKRILQGNGYSLTKVREFIFTALIDASQPQSMHELIEAVKGRADRVSVYRTVELFEELGIVQRVNIGWKYKLELSEMFLDHHHHMTCLACGKIATVGDEPQFEAMIARLAKANGFRVTLHQLEMQGYCTACQRDAI